MLQKGLEGEAEAEAGPSSVSAAHADEETVAGKLQTRFEAARGFGSESGLNDLLIFIIIFISSALQQLPLKPAWSRLSSPLSTSGTLVVLEK